MRTFTLPDLGEGLADAEIVAWHVAEGDTVKADDLLVSVETDKAVVDVPAPWSGRIARLCATPGERLKVGAAVVEYDGGAPAASPAKAAAAAPSAAAAVAAPPKAPARGGRAMPAVRQLARELGLDLAGIAGSGPEGAVLVRDVAEAFRRSVGAGAASAASLPASVAEAGWEPLKGPRRAMAEAMTRANAEVMLTSVFEEADTGAWPAGEDITVRLIRALCNGLAISPALNVWLDAARGRRLHTDVDLGLAVDTPDGLIVPVLRGAQKLDRARLRIEVDRLTAGARARSLAPHELKGATFTLTNYGMMAGLNATPAVVPPQVGILGAGRSRRTVVADGDGFAVRPVLPLSLSYDHRAVTGGEAARFLAAVVEDLSLPS